MRHASGEDPDIHGYAITEKLHESRTTLVYRGISSGTGEPVILKLLTPDATTKQAEVARLRHESDIISKLCLPGIVRLVALEEHQGSPLLVMADIHGTSLDRLERPLPMVELLELAIELARALEAVHQHQIIHKNLNPSNIIWNRETKQLNLIDFGIADDIPERSVSPQAPSAIEGTLEYTSPEQTGRMNRVADYRADFYSLGVTLYRLLTGRLPFVASDALGLVHMHIAGTAQPPHRLNPAIPEAVSHITMKLMAKMADDRYQSAYGLKVDLERCLRDLEATGAVQPFALGLNDVTDRIRIPQRLYGRQPEMDQLFDAFARVSAGGGELVLVAGPTGTGKTALVHETFKALTARRAVFLEGKFDLLRRNIPYSAWIQALAGLARHVLMENESDLAEWRQRLLKAARGIGKVLTDVIPDLELIIGPQPAIPELSASEAQNRFSYVFLELIRSIATPAHPLVIFLDDAQWIDTASLKLLQTVIVRPGVVGLLVIVAFRDDEVDALHPLTASLEALRGEDAQIGRMALGNLSQASVNELIADALHLDQSRTVDLTELLYSKTAGNPFFLRQTLKALAEKHLIDFDVENRRWHWDIGTLRHIQMTDNVVTLMLERIHQLPTASQAVLSLAACVGSHFNQALLSALARQTEASMRESLEFALREGLIISFDRDYRFAHDRIQQAAYSLLSDSDQKRNHLEIGRIMLRGLAEHAMPQQLFAIVDHLNSGAELLTTDDERLELADLNLQASKRANASAAFFAADKYVQSGVALLSRAWWSVHYQLMLDVYTRAAEAASLVGDFVRTDSLFKEVIAHARSPLDTVEAYRSKMTSFLTQAKIQDFLDCGLEILDGLGVHLQHFPAVEAVRSARAGTASLYHSGSIAAIADLQQMTDPQQLAIMRVFELTQLIAKSGSPNLYALLACETVRRTIQYGITSDSATGLASYANLLCEDPDGSFDDGYQFSELALRIVERFGAFRLRPKVAALIVVLIWPYKKPLKDVIAVLEQLFQAAKEVGDFDRAGFIATHCCLNAYFSGTPLVKLERMMAAYDSADRQIHAEVARQRQPAFWQATQNLLGWSSDPCVLKGRAYDVDQALPVFERTNNIASKAVLHFNTLLLAYLFGNHDLALSSSKLTEDNIGPLTGTILSPIWCFYDSLTRLALYAKRSPEEKAQTLQRIASNQALLQSVASRAPMNYLNKWCLVEAERERVLGAGMKAVKLYDEAIALSEKHGLIQERALANEAAGRFWVGEGKPEFGRIHLERAREDYRQWQAWAKVKALEAEYGQLLAKGAVEYQEMNVLDASSLMKAAHTISSEIEMGRFLDTAMHIVTENAGAQSGFLLMQQADRWVVAAKGAVGRAEADIPRRTPADASELVSLGVVRLVARTSERVVLDDAANQGDFVNDSHIKEGRTKSLLCAPLLSRGRLVGIIYLENNLTTHAFTPARVRLLETLLSQIAISFENAQIYEALRASEARFRTVIENSPIIVFTLSRDGVFTFSRGRGLKKLGLAPDEVVGKSISEVYGHNPQIVGDFNRALAGEAFVGSTEEAGVAFETGWAPVRGVDGEVVGVTGVSVDITERRHSEQKIRKLNQELEQRVVERTKELAAANEELEAFAYSASHDLRAPLRHVDGFVRLLQKRADSGLDEQSRHYMAVISDSVGQMAKLIDDLLSFSRMGRNAMSRDRFALGALASEVVAELAPDAAGRVVHWRVGLLPEVTGDRSMLRLVLVNLLSNALKFTRTRGEAEIEIGCLPSQEDEQAFFVRDNGVGFDMAYANKLFSVFQRLHRSDEFEGTGIGLASVRRIIARHGGRTWADARVDEGATFCFTLPKAPAGITES